MSNHERTDTLREVLPAVGFYKPPPLPDNLYILAELQKALDNNRHYKQGLEREINDLKEQQQPFRDIRDAEFDNGNPRFPLPQEVVDAGRMVGKFGVEIFSRQLAIERVIDRDIKALEEEIRLFSENMAKEEAEKSASADQQTAEPITVTAGR